LVVLDAVLSLPDHPSVEDVIGKVRKKHPNIATGTIYKILETLSQHGIIGRVKTAQDKMRFDPITEKHHHLYCEGSNRIEDYFDEELTALLEQYFKTRDIPGFQIEDLRLEIRGRFSES